jgi:hypothetical protein
MMHLAPRRARDPAEAVARFQAQRLNAAAPLENHCWWVNNCELGGAWRSSLELSMPLRWDGIDEFHLADVCDRLSSLGAIGPTNRSAIYRAISTAIIDGIAAAWTEHVLSKLTKEFKRSGQTQQELVQLLIEEYGEEEKLDSRNVGKLLRGGTAITLQRCGRIAFVLELTAEREPASHALEKIHADRRHSLMPIAIEKGVAKISPSLQRHLKCLTDRANQAFVALLDDLEKRRSASDGYVHRIQEILGDDGIDRLQKAANELKLGDAVSTKRQKAARRQFADARKQICLAFELRAGRAPGDPLETLIEALARANQLEKVVEDFGSLRGLKSYDDIQDVLSCASGSGCIDSETHSEIRNLLDSFENTLDGIMGSLFYVDRATVRRWFTQEHPIGLKDFIMLLQVLKPTAIGDLPGFEWAKVSRDEELAFKDSAIAQAFQNAISYVIRHLSRRQRLTTLDTIDALREYGRQCAAGRSIPIDVNGERLLPASKTSLYPEHRHAHWLVCLIIDSMTLPLPWLSDDDPLNLEDGISNPDAI